MPGGDASVSDSPVIDDVVFDTFRETQPPPPPLSCEEAGTPLDASCLGFDVPDGGWQPIGFQTGIVGCGAGVYSTQTVLGNAGLAAGACSCAPCSTLGSWSCSVGLGEGTDCPVTNTNATFQNFCTDTQHSSFSEVLTRSGTPTCTGGQENGNQQADASQVTMCFPQSCSDDYCGLANLGFKLCIYNPNVTDGGCPTSFQVSSQIVGQAPVVECGLCSACQLANADAGCTGTVTAYDEAGCTGDALDASSTSDACLDLSPVQYNSLYFDAGPLPVPSCPTPPNVTTGNVVLNAPWTICCSK